MDSESDRKTRESTDEQGKGHVVEDECGHQIWQDTIKHVKLSLMKTGVFCMSKAQERLMKLRETGADNTANDLDVVMESIDDGGFDPYDSAKK